MHAYLITGGTPQLRTDEILRLIKEAGSSPFDTIYLKRLDEEEHIGIDKVRAFTKALSLAPQHSSHTVGIIEDAHTLTTEAQNALLKLLEEPAPHALIFAETQSSDFLLPTIVSRCQLIHIVKPILIDTIVEKELLALVSASTGAKLTLIEGIARDRNLAKEWTQKAISAARSLDTIKFVKLIRLLQLAQEALEANVNPKLVLDTVFLWTPHDPENQSGR